jgi:hypothetical protein
MSISKARLKKLESRKKKIKDSGGGNNSFLFIKADETVRVRPLPVGEDDEPALEVTQFYLGAEIKGVISPKTFGEPCALMEKYEELKSSSDEDDQALATKLKPKPKYVIAVIKKKDKMGKEVDEQLGVRLMQIPKGVYQQLIDLFLEPEQGDFTDPAEGYDVKITRTGSGQFDTEYSVVPCKPSPLPKKYNKTYNLEELLRKEVPSYDETQEILNQFLGVDSDDEKPKKKKKSFKKEEEAPVKKKKKMV